jgi:hypothetical protein
MLSPFLTSVGQILEFVDNHWFLFYIAKLENYISSGFCKGKTEEQNHWCISETSKPHRL